jgi:hypothetical protein
MKIFISWSGQQSNAVAEALKKWIGDIFQGDPEPWMSEHDIYAGDRGLNTLASVLEQTNLGILCITRENINAPWILFEAGSLAKLVTSSWVIPYCVGLSVNDIDYPLRQFQAVEATKNGTFRLVQTINSARSNRLPTEKLRHTFETWWPQLHEKLNKIHVIQRMVIINVGTLAENVQQVLLEKQKSGFTDIKVKVLAADAHHLLFRHLKPVIINADLKNISVEFCIVDPKFATDVKVNPEFAERARESLRHIEELKTNRGFAKRHVSILSSRTYQYYPNTWGILINNSDLFIGFHDWIATNRLEGTQHGLIYLTSADPLWDRFYSLFTSWFEHSGLWQEINEVKTNH